MLVYPRPLLLAALYFLVKICDSSTDFTLCFQDHCYMKSDTRMTWVDADDYCRDRDAILPSIHNSEENAYISDNVCMTYDKALFLTQGCWIGLTDEVEEGVWVWLDGSNSSDYENWDPNEPNNLYKKEHYAHLWGKGTWNDEKDSINLWAICMRAVLTENPTLSPSDSPTLSPSDSPTLSPSVSPTSTLSPSDSPTLPPKADPTASPSVSRSPSTRNPTKLPTSPSPQLQFFLVPLGVALIIIIFLLVRCAVHCCVLRSARPYCSTEILEEDRWEGETKSPLTNMHQRTQDIDSRL